MCFAVPFSKRTLKHDFRQFERRKILTRYLPGRASQAHRGIAHFGCRRVSGPVACKDPPCDLFYQAIYVSHYRLGRSVPLFNLEVQQHQAVYTDLYRIPFAGSYYNWGFYYFYGLVTEACLRLFRLVAVWIATTGRLITVTFTLLSGGIFFLAQKLFVNAGLFANSRIPWAWCAIAACSPLVAFSSITVRPDIGALALSAQGSMRCCIM